MPHLLDSEYRYDRATGQLYYEAAGSGSPLGGRDIALAWVSDEDGACLMKHGLAEMVAQRAELIRAIDPSLTMVTIPHEVFSHPEAGPDVLEEINKCLSISGRVAGLEERLAEIAATHGVEISSRPGQDMPPETGTPEFH